jgi:hypothetical protein
MFRSLGHPPQHIGFRAGNAAQLVLQNTELLEGNASEPYLVVNAVGNDVDLIIVVAGRIAAIRSFRLPSEHPQKNLAGEIERTLAIGLEGIEPPPIRHIILFGDGTETELQDDLMQSGLSVQWLNPLTLPNVSAPGDISNPEKFAPLIGSFVVQSKKITPVIDFLHPKEAPKPPNYLRLALLVLVFFGIVCTGFFLWNRTEIRRLETQLAKVKAEHQEVAGNLQQLTPSWSVLQQTYLWESQNVLWLDVLKDLSEVLPSSTDLVAAQMTLTTGPIQISNNPPRFAAGSIVLSGMVRDPSVLMNLQSNLHLSGRYWMQYSPPSPNPAGGGYPWTFRTTIYRLR